MNRDQHIAIGLYGKSALDVLNAVFKSIVTHRGFGYSLVSSLKCDRAPDDEVVLSVKHWNSRWHNYDASENKKYIAYVLKREVYTRLENAGHDPKTVWNRSNSGQVPNIDAQVRMVYCIYDALKSRKDFQKRYDRDFIAEFIGVRLDPIMTELNLLKLDTAKQYATEYAAERGLIDEQKDMRDASYALYAECNRVIDDLRVKQAAEIASINAQFSENARRISNES